MKSFFYWQRSLSFNRGWTKTWSRRFKPNTILCVLLNLFCWLL